MTTPANVARAAEIPDALPLRETSVIGLMIDPAGNSALIRTAQGTIAKVGVGSRIGRNEVLAIDESGLMLDHNGLSVRMALPPVRAGA